jgi:hypothetical protein
MPSVCWCNFCAVSGTRSDVESIIGLPLAFSLEKLKADFTLVLKVPRYVLNRLQGIETTRQRTELVRSVGALRERESGVGVARQRTERVAFDSK